jgi:hypothetical protein
VVTKAEWTVWKENSKNARMLKKYPFIRKLAALVEAALDSRPWKVEVEQLDCPNCECPMSQGEELCTCVKCGNTGIKPVPSIHAQLAGDDPPIV